MRVLPAQQWGAPAPLSVVASPGSRERRETVSLAPGRAKYVLHAVENKNTERRSLQLAYHYHVLPARRLPLLPILADTERRKLVTEMLASFLVDRNPAAPTVFFVSVRALHRQSAHR